MGQKANGPGNSPIVHFPFSVTAGQLRALIALLGLGLFLVVAGTWLAVNPEHIPGWLPEWGRFLVFQMHLGPENRIGTWYSSFLFLLPAPTALACFWIQHRTASDRRDRLAAYGWLGVAAVFVMLSATELGSLHNRAGLFLANPLSGIGLGGWVGVLAIPIAVVGAMLVWFAWRQLQEHPVVGVVLGAATLVLLSIPVQEYIESQLRHEFRGEHGEYLRPALHVILEEGGEMVSALLFFTAFLLFLAVRLPVLRRGGWFTPGEEPSRAGLELHQATTDTLLRGGRLEGTIRLSAGRFRAGLYAVLAAVGIGMIVSHLVFNLWWSGAPEHWGRPLNWFPSMLAALTALSALYLWRHGAGVSASLARARGSLLAVALLSIVLAANQGADLALLHVLWEGSPRRQLAVAVGLAAGALGTAVWLASRLARAGRLLVGLWGVTLVFALLALPHGAVAPVMAAGYGALTVGLGRAGVDGKTLDAPRPMAAAAMPGR